MNYSTYNVCNRCVSVPQSNTEATADALCECCRFNHTIPDLTVAGNQTKWARLEAAKRRLFYDLDELGLPYGTAEEGFEPPLAFDFKGDVTGPNNRLLGLGQTERVFTGHDSGMITLNIREADDVEREKARVSLGEPQRTLLGHFRHEIGHYYWDLLVKNRCEADCIAIFGDHQSPEYAVALDTYYKNGPPANWAENYISAYASMHPWEDFAETWLTYLVMVSELDTAFHAGFLGADTCANRSLDEMVKECQTLSISLNEMNRSIGLLDAMPKPIVAPVVAKLQFIHDLIARNSRDVANNCELVEAGSAES